MRPACCTTQVPRHCLTACLRKGAGTPKLSVLSEALSARRGTTKSPTRQERRMRGKEIVGGGTEPIVLSRIRDHPCPLFGQGGVKLLRAAMHDARLLSSYQQPPSRLMAPMSSVQHPGDPQMFDVIHADAIVKHRPRLPRVRQLVIGHGSVQSLQVAHAGGDIRACSGNRVAIFPSPPSLPRSD